MSVGLSRDAKHFYEAVYPGLEQGKVPGITSVIGVMDKPALVGWAKRETAIAAVRNWPALRAMMEQYPPGDGDLAYHPAVSFLKATPGFQRDSAADIGTRVHAIAEAVQKGEKPVIADDVVPFAEAYIRDFLEPFKPKSHPLYIEAMVYDSGASGLCLPYGGTMDLFCEISGETWLLDFKTNRSGAYAETALQLAAGRYAEFIGRPGDPKKYPVPKVDRCGVVWVRPEGAQLIEYQVTPQEQQAFYACRLIWQWVNGRSKDVKGKAA
jgi:hypothetical protein